MTRITACTFVAIAFVAAAGFANAAESDRSAPQMTVSYADLDLSHAAGAQILLQRLSMASEQVCGGTPDQRNLTMKSYYDACYGNAMRGAIAAVRSPLVAELHGNPALANAPRNAAERIASRGDGFGR
jgi:UrcA family protein